MNPSAILGKGERGSHLKFQKHDFEITVDPGGSPLVGQLSGWVLTPQTQYEYRGALRAMPIFETRYGPKNQKC